MPSELDEQVWPEIDYRANPQAGNFQPMPANAIPAAQLAAEPNFNYRVFDEANLRALNWGENPGPIQPPAPEPLANRINGAIRDYYDAAHQLNVDAWLNRHRRIEWDREPVELVVQETDDDMLARTPRIKLLNSFKLGADPEWVLLDKNGVLVVSDLPHDGQIGHDHGGRVLEIRPTPSRSCRRLMQNMQKLLTAPQLAKWQAPRWRAGGVAIHAPARQEPLGGHIHFDLPFNANYHGLNGHNLQYHLQNAARNYAQPATWMEEQMEAVKRADATIKGCDRITEELEALDILPQKEAIQRRRTGHGYGALGDVRESNGHLEYRTPVSWLFNPRTAYFCLVAYKLAAAEPKSIPPLKGNWPSLLGWFKQFASKDDDAARISEKCDSLKSIQGDPDCDFKSLWAEPISI